MAIGVVQVQSEERNLKPERIRLFLCPGLCTYYFPPSFKGFTPAVQQIFPPVWKDIYWTLTIKAILQPRQMIGKSFFILNAVTRSRQSL